jgi:hypothetical protein
MLLKSFDTDVKEKATIFEEAKLKMFMVAKMETSYWLVRQAITIVAFFGGLRHQECLDLVVEKMVRTPPWLLSRLVVTARSRSRPSAAVRRTAIITAAGKITPSPASRSRWREISRPI